MSEPYSIPDTNRHRGETTIKGSRFIVTMAHTPDAAQARDFIKAIKQEFPDATHNCWAYQCGPPGDSARVGLSDDGEPSGTAGRPMYTVLLHSGVGEIAAVVTRYFGGTKLGTGGLVKAYTQLVQQGLASLPLKEKIHTTTLAFSLEYAAIRLFKRLLVEFNGTMLDEQFAEKASFIVAVPSCSTQLFEHEVTTRCKAARLSADDS